MRVLMVVTILAACACSSSSSGTAGNSDAGQVAKYGNSIPTGPTPNLVPGTWVNITPAGVNLAPGCCQDEGFNGNTFGVTSVEIDPSNPATLYITVDVEGLWRSTDAGSTWTRLGTPPAAPDFGPNVNYLDSPVAMRVDPNNSKHLYATQGVRGQTVGFWISTDAGDTWARPPAFDDITKTTATNDVTNVAVDPTDFSHVLIASHSPWANNVPHGLLETKDGGNTFIAHPAPDGWPGSGTFGVNFLFEPTQKIGDSNTWLVSTDGGGSWRTDNGGSTWTQVSQAGAVHGGNNTIYYTQQGVAYVGGNFQMMRTPDNGLSWTSVGPKFGDGYYQVIGDGNLLYAQEANTGGNTAGPQPYVTSPESDGMTWNPYMGGAQTFTGGPCNMRFDPVDRILYSANWDAGLWALKIP